MTNKTEANDAHTVLFLDETFHTKHEMYEAGLSGLTNNQLSDSLGRLVESGEVKVRTRGQGMRTANEYALAA